MCGFFLEFFIPFHMVVCLSIHDYYIILIAIALVYKSYYLTVEVLQPFFFFKIAFSILCPLYFHINFRISFLIFTKKKGKAYWDFDWKCVIAQHFGNWKNNGHM